MTKFIKEIDMLLSGLLNAPEFIVNHLLAQEKATLEELENLADEQSKRYVKGWLDRMITYLALERFWYPATDEHTYSLSQFAKDMIAHIESFEGHLSASSPIEGDTV